jgi:hypothetical protein
MLNCQSGWTTDLTGGNLNFEKKSQQLSGPLVGTRRVRSRYAGSEKCRPATATVFFVTELEAECVKDNGRQYA